MRPIHAVRIQQIRKRVERFGDFPIARWNFTFPRVGIGSGRAQSVSRVSPRGSGRAPQLKQAALPLPDGLDLEEPFFEVEEAAKEPTLQLSGGAENAVLLDSRSRRPRSSSHASCRF